MSSVPFLDLAAQHAEIADEVRLALDDVYARAAFVGGAEVAAFESEYAAYVGTEHCTASASPTAPTRWSSRCAPSGCARAAR